MSTGNLLYLLMSIGVFAVFGLVLAYQSWQQSQLGPDMIGTVPIPAKAPARIPGHAAHV